jgi:hypothetical protein
MTSLHILQVEDVRIISSVWCSDEEQSSNDFKRKGDEVSEVGDRFKDVSAAVAMSGTRTLGRGVRSLSLI